MKLIRLSYIIPLKKVETCARFHCGMARLDPRIIVTTIIITAVMTIITTIIATVNIFSTTTIEKIDLKRYSQDYVSE